MTGVSLHYSEILLSDLFYPLIGLSYPVWIVKDLSQGRGVHQVFHFHVFKLDVEP